MFGRGKKGEPKQVKMGDPVIYMDKHGGNHVALVAGIRGNLLTLAYVGFRGAIVTAYSVPRDTPTRRGDFWTV